ncbi:MAG: thioredoxin domain-containing protein [archaeon]
MKEKKPSDKGKKTIEKPEIKKEQEESIGDLKEFETREEIQEKIDSSTEEENWDKLHLEEPEKEEIKAKEKKSFPWIIAVLAVIFIIFAGLALNKVFFENTPKQGSFEEPALVEIKNFYSSECSFCSKENSIIANFKAKDINFSVESIDLSKEENKHYIDEFGLTVIPSALVNAASLEKYPLQENLIKKAFTQKKGYFIVPESYLDSLPHNIMFLEKPESCNAEQGKVFVEEFSDYQCLGCAIVFDATKKAREKFAGEMIFRYKNYIVHKNSLNAAIAAECAAKQGRFFEFNKYLFEKSFPDVFGLESNAIDNSLPEVINAGALVTQIPDTKAFSECVNTQEPLEKINQETQQAKDLGVNFAPSLVVDCKYIIQGNEQIQKINDLICELHPELNSCKDTAN